MTNSSISIGSINDAIGRRTMSLPQLAEFARDRDLPAVYEDHDWRRGRKFSRANADHARAVHDAEAGVQDKAPAHGRGQPPPPPIRKWNGPISNARQVATLAETAGNHARPEDHGSNSTTPANEMAADIERN
jgi:hypothetical protein